MPLSIGIVGLPNVGKSTLFNAITNSSVDAQNYPFCTIEPNIGVVEVPDQRLKRLAEVNQSQKIICATIEFFDIAGLVQGAAKGEGLGNKFLSNIRETSAIAHVVRCFDDDNVVHVSGKTDPLADVEIINLELILADLEYAQKCYDTQSRKAKGQDKEEARKGDVLGRICDHFGKNKPVRKLDLTDDERRLLRGYNFLTAKKVVYVANVSEDLLTRETEQIKKLKDYARNDGDECMVLCAKLEAELSLLEPDEQKAYLHELGVEETGLAKLAQACFHLLDLQTYLTTGPKETRAWTIKRGDTAPQAAGVIHTDFEKGFIRANIVSFDHFVTNQGWKHAKEKGLVRQEGKEYVMQDGDVVEFLFHV